MSDMCSGKTRNMNNQENIRVVGWMTTSESLVLYVFFLIHLAQRTPPSFEGKLTLLMGQRLFPLVPT